jgi:hypothetical protein
VVGAVACLLALSWRAAEEQRTLDPGELLAALFVALMLAAALWLDPGRRRARPPEDERTRNSFGRFDASALLRSSPPRMKLCSWATITSAPSISSQMIRSWSLSGSVGFGSPVICWLCRRYAELRPVSDTLACRLTRGRGPMGTRYASGMSVDSA